MTERALTEREIKALQIAAKSKIVRKGNAWLVPSLSHPLLCDERYITIRYISRAREIFT